jgi:hypothetical protein
VVVDEVVGCSDVVEGEVDEVVGRIEVVDEDVDDVVRRVVVVLDTGGVGEGKSVGVGKIVGVGNGVGVGVCALTRPVMWDEPSVLKATLRDTTKSTTEYFFIIGLTRPLSLLIRL